MEFAKKIKLVRAELKLSHEEFAYRFGGSFAQLLTTGKRLI